MNFANTFFYRTHPVVASVKACNFTNIRLCHGFIFVNFLKLFGTYFDAPLEFSKSSQKYWRKNICCDDSDNAIFPNTRAFAFTRQPIKRNFT